jgi:hypothetical protein
MLRRTLLLAALTNPCGGYVVGRCAAPRLCADAAASSSSSDERARVPPTAPVDFQATEAELQQHQRPAEGAELAEHLPAWAATLVLDDEANAEYEAGMAADRRARPVDGRSWDGAGDGAGAEEFTAEELASDYNLPLETMLTQLLAIGVPADRLEASKPVKGLCTAAQLVELLAFLTTCDPIACREELAEESLAEMAQRMPPLSAAQLVRLCEAHSMPAVCGEETRLQRADHAMLFDLAQTELAFLVQPGTPPPRGT